MIDPAEMQVRIQQLVRDNESLLGYMNPTKKQREQIQRNSTDIAFFALAINDFYKGEMKK